MAPTAMSAEDKKCNSNADPRYTVDGNSFAIFYTIIIARYQLKVKDVSYSKTDRVG
jgi:hypothetical protein